MNNYKVVLLGNSCVGKSSITHRFVYNQFNSHTESTIGASYFKKKLIVDGKEIYLNVWDTAGASSRFSPLLPMYIRAAKLLLLVYDITNSESFNKISSILLDVRKNMSTEDMIVMLVGNKSDMENRMIMYEEGKSYAKQNNLLFMECSACTGENVLEIFNEVASLLVKKFPITPISDSIILKPDKKETSCCYK